MERLLLPIPDAAAVLGVGRTTCYGLLAAGDIQSVTIGGRRLVVADSLREYVDRLTAHATSTPVEDVAS
jgi:excisionase family DNA binding protein